MSGSPVNWSPGAPDEHRRHRDPEEHTSQVGLSHPVHNCVETEPQERHGGADGGAPLSRSPCRSVANTPWERSRAGAAPRTCWSTGAATAPRGPTDTCPVAQVPDRQASSVPTARAALPSALLVRKGFGSSAAGTMDCSLASIRYADGFKSNARWRLADVARACVLPPMLMLLRL